MGSVSDTLDKAAPEGFREHASGLIVPAELSREREVWTWAEWRTLEKATALLAGREMQVYFRCNHQGCQSEPMQRLRRADGGITMRCRHKDREVRRDL